MDVNQIFFIGHNKYGQAGISEEQHNKKYLTPKQIVFKTFIKQVSCGNHHSAILTIDGLIYTMGSNIHGTLGLGNSQSINYAFKPTLVKDLKDVDLLVSGSHHMCAIKQGELYTWGKGIDGQLGHGNMKNIFTPTKVQALGNNVQTVSCGLNHTLVMLNTSNGNLNGYAFGSGIYGQLGCGSNRNFNYPVNIKLQNITALSAGENHSLFVSHGQIYGCGDNSYFQIGNFQSIKGKKYVLEPVKLQWFHQTDVSLVDCYNMSVALTDSNQAYVWGGKNKIWPPALIQQSQVLNVKITNEKVYYLNDKNDLVSLTFKQNGKQETQTLLSNRYILDFDAGQFHLFAVGDIIAQIQEKQVAEYLSVWGGESLSSSKQKFSVRNLENQSFSKVQSREKLMNIAKDLPEFYFTKHLHSGNSYGQLSSKKQPDFQSIQSQPFDQTFENNMSSSIEIQKNTLKINESETKSHLQEKNFAKVKQFDLQNDVKLQTFKPLCSVIQNQEIKYTQTKLQRLMDKMEQKTIHLKKKYPYEQSLENSDEKESKSITKTPSSYIKKEPERFVVGSEQFSQINRQIAEPKISNFQEKMPLKEVNIDNLPKRSSQYENDTKEKIKSKSMIIYDKNDEEVVTKQQKSIKLTKNDRFQQNLGKDNELEKIFMNLLKKHHREKVLNEEEKEVTLLKKNSSGLISKDTDLSHSGISSTSIGYIKKRNLQNSSHRRNFKVSPINEKILAVSKISDNSDISSKSLHKKNSELIEFSRSNRQLRYELRDRDFKISQLQEDLSKKEIQIQMLYRRIGQLQNSTMNCQRCGNVNGLNASYDNDV